jgi:hypothetical protein
MCALFAFIFAWSFLHGYGISKKSNKNASRLRIMMMLRAACSMFHAQSRHWKVMSISIAPALPSLPLPQQK